MAASQMIRRSHPGLTDALRLEQLPGQRRVRAPASSRSQAGEITGHEPQRQPESDDNHDPLSHAQPFHPAHGLTLAVPNQ